MIATKVCKRCGTEKPTDDFITSKAAAKPRLRSYCRPCHAANNRESRTRHLEATRARELAYSRANAERKRENANRWYSDPANRAKAIAREKTKYEHDPEYKRDRAHQSRARRAGSPVIEFVRRREVYDRDQGVCHVCGDPVPWKNYEMDHVVALSRGGEHSYANVRVSHGVCNRGRRGT